MHSVSDDPMIWESLLPYLKTLDKFVLAARAEEIQREQPENAVDENCIDAAAGDMNVTEIGAMGAAVVDQYHSADQDATSKPGGRLKAQFPDKVGPTTFTNPHRKDQVIELQYEGCDENYSLKSRTGGTAGEAKGKAEGSKKRRRCGTGEIDGAENEKTKGEKTCKNRSKNWTDEEMKRLLEVVAQRKSVKSRFEKHFGRKRSWGDIAENAPGRTGVECRMRMNTVTKSCKTIKQFCENKNKEFRVYRMGDK
ncbi:uncharacterized protein [Physcomitrium patens]|nr:uncharacterized protein LOC112294978 [Physcomitrium patens]|eukprot:XP_024401778.1 uncharacterized protein LOC112294978 [Physcomitrella patens]